MVLRPPAAGNSFLRIQTKPQLCSQQGKEALRAPAPRLVRRKSAGYLKATPPVLPWSNRTDSKYGSMFPDEFRDATARPCVVTGKSRQRAMKHLPSFWNTAWKVFIRSQCASIPGSGNPLLPAASVPISFGDLGRFHSASATGNESPSCEGVGSKGRDGLGLARPACWVQFKLPVGGRSGSLVPPRVLPDLRWFLGT